MVEYDTFKLLNPPLHSRVELPTTPNACIRPIRIVSTRLHTSPVIDYASPHKGRVTLSIKAMSEEADTPNNQSLPEPTAPIDASSTDVTDATGSENKPEDKGRVSEDNAQSAPPQQTGEVATDISADLTQKENTSATSATTTVATTGDTTLMPANEADWLALIQKLRQHNRGLINRVNHLEQTLGECQEVLQSQKAKLQAQDTIIAKASQEITLTQEQMTRLFRELESSHQVAQRQQILIETLTEQLESSQERMAQMERECALTQQRYNEQSHLLMQTENTARELRDRLQRQQRHTLQFKAALEKCLEVPAINYEANTEAINSSVTVWQEDHLNSILAAPGILPKAQPIQPWSAQPELLEDSDSVYPSDYTPALPQSFSPVDSSDWEALLPDELGRMNDELMRLLETRNFETRNEASLQQSSDVEEMPRSQTDEAAGDYEPDSLMTDLALTQQELQQHLRQEALPDLGWLSVLLQEPEADLPPESVIARVDDDAQQPDLNEAVDVPPSEETAAEAVVHTSDLAQSRDASFRVSSDPSEHPPAILSQPNWPSPVVYPLRPSRGRKSLAAVELPTFPKMGTQQSEQLKSEE